MSITTELEKLTALRDRGDLSEEEYTKAKALLLSGQDAPPPIANSSSAETPASVKQPSDTPADLLKKKKIYLICGILSSITVVLSAISAIIAPGIMNVIILSIFTIASVLWWVEYSKLKGECVSRG